LNFTLKKSGSAPKKVAIRRSGNSKKKILKIAGKPKHLILAGGVRFRRQCSRNAVLVAMTAGLVSQQQLKAFRKTVSSKWIRRRLIFRSQPFVDLTKKPAETRMGKGRGTKVAKRVSPVSRGTALVEIRVRRHLDVSSQLTRLY